MKVLIVESEKDLATIWSRHLQRMGMTVAHVRTQCDAIDKLGHYNADVLILNLMLSDGAAFAVADYASYRLPEARIIFVTNTSFFSDGSIFSFAPNACAFVRTTTPPEDLAAMVEHYGGDERA